MSTPIIMIINVILIFLGITLMLKGIDWYERLKTISKKDAEIIYFICAILGSGIISIGAMNVTKILKELL